MKLLLIPVVILFITVSCHSNGPILIVNDGTTQGTTYHIVYESPGNIDYHASIDSLLVAFDQSLSNYNDSSLITAINNSENGGLVDNHFQTVYLKAVEVYHTSGKLFDLTVWPLIEAYGFGNREPVDLDSAQVDSLLQYVGMGKTKLDSNRFTKQNKHIKIDVNALAKGYSVDLVSAFLLSKGITNHLVEIGGEVYAHGKKGDQSWRIGIDKPIENNLSPGDNLQAIVEIENRALATSGNYRKFYEKNGMKIVHSMNPKTGYPEIHNLLSATIFANDCMTADAYATACMVMGLEKSRDMIENNPEIEGYLIYNDASGKYQVFQSAGARSLIEEVSSD